MKSSIPGRAMYYLATAVSLYSFASTADAAAPKAWFKADSIEVANGAEVTLWPDSSKSGNVAQAGGSAPVFAATGMNGYPSVQFSGAETMVFPRSVQDDFSIIILFKTNAAAGGSDSFYAGSGLVSGERPGGVDDFGMSIRDNGRILAGVGNPDTTIRSSQGHGDGNPHIATFTRVRSTGVLNLSVDRIARTPLIASGRQALGVYPQLTIGAHPGPIGPFLSGDIAEIILFEGALTSSEALTIEDSLRGKYGLPNGTVPQIPSNPTAQGSRINWSESPGAKTYSVLRSTTAGGTYTAVAENLTTPEYVDSTATAGQTYFYQIKAANPVGSSAASTTVEGTTLALPASGPVLINEIHYNGLNNTLHTDFVELFNYSTSPADLTGWRLSSGIEYTFPPGTVIPAGGYLVIAQDPATIQAVWGVAALGPYAKSLGSDGDTIRLRNAGDFIVADVTYGSGFPWPCAANGDGASAELVNPALDATKGSSWRASVTPLSDLTGEIASPGAQNFQFRMNPAPNIEQVTHSPSQPSSSNSVKVTASLSDAGGVASAQLSYQLVTPGNYIPAYLPLPIVNHNIDTSQPRPANPAFEDPANWTTAPMNDDGMGGDAVAGDGIYTATIPAQANRTLVRYRVSAIDSAGISARAPFADDASKNFAYYVYNGVPEYQGISAATLTTLPVYQLLGRKADYDECVAYDSTKQLTGNTPSWTFENWGATMIFEGVVYDHIKYRLHGGNGRYYHKGKRGFRFFFNKGYHFQNRDNDGALLPTKWKSMTTENCWENRGTLTYSLNEVVNFHLWRKIGVPAPRSNWGHFRTVTTVAEQADAYHGDFWGLMVIHEDYNGDFLDSHGLEKGNLYKLTRDATDGASQQRYQAPDAVNDGSDHNNIYANLTSNKGEAFIRRYVNVENWSRYHALCQAVRHYDYWPTGDNNGAYYFAPDFTGQTDHLGKLWIMPNDVDATWGPTWNEGKDRVFSAIFDSPANTGLYPVYFNAVREVRDLLWQPEQINPMLDEFAAIIAPFIPADSIRWKGGPDEAGNYNGLAGAGSISLANLVADMKKFAWTGGSWPGGDVGAGGRAAFMDNLQLGVSNSEGSKIPATPVITYQGPSGYPANELTFGTSGFSDPQGATDFAALQWRVAEVTDPSAPTYNPSEKFKLEWTSNLDSGEITAFASSFTFPASACQAGHAYRARVRHKDISGRWSHWSAPVQFIAGENEAPVRLVVSELMYRPPSVSAAETAAGFTDRDSFEFLEIRNVGSQPTDLSGCNFDKGITFTFSNGAILQPGQCTLVVQNAAAINFRYGTGRPISGAYSGKLANEGERIRLLAADTNPLIDFSYDIVAPWPVAASGSGSSLVLIHPELSPDPTNPLNWRASRRSGGAPGFSDSQTFSQWANSLSVLGGPSDDDDGDGIPNFLEYALVGNPRAFNASSGGEIQNLTIDGIARDYLSITFRRLVDAEDIDYVVQYSESLRDWAATPVLVKSVNPYDGTVTETWRAPLSNNQKGFMRVSTIPAP